MATDEVMYDNDRAHPLSWSLSGDHLLRTSDYARLTESGRMVQVRGSAFPTGDGGGDGWDFNYFNPEAARRLARYILALADDAEKNPAAEELATALARTTESCIDYYEQAQDLIAEGWHK